MTDTAVAAPVAAPVVEQQSSKLDDIMLAMDVVDTLRHDQKITERELAEGDREVDLIERLRDIYRKQGIDVPDEILRQGVKALREERFVYKPPRDSLSVKLARLYVTRGTWGKWALGALARARHRRRSSVLSGLCGAHRADADDPRRHHAALRRHQPRGDSGCGPRPRGSPRDGRHDRRPRRKAEAARAAVADLERLRDDVRMEYDVRIVSRPGESTGVWRRPRRNPMP